MSAQDAPLVFQQIHIEVARNATDDFNPFHDKNRWHRIEGNPFGGAIVLGFQLESLIEYHVRLHREANGELAMLDEHQLGFSNYQFNFVSAVKCGQVISVDIKSSQLREGDNTTLSNRVSLKADGTLALLGFKRESQQPLVLEDASLVGLPELEKCTAHEYIPGTPYFLTRKYMTNSNGKNFLSGSLVEQADYFDELADRVSYPEIFPCALLSCVLLEKGVYDGIDFSKTPMVYTTHKISVDRALVSRLHSNDVLNLLARRLNPDEDTHEYECFGVVGADDILFRARIDLVPLHAITV